MLNLLISPLSGSRLSRAPGTPTTDASLPLHRRVIQRTIKPLELLSVAALSAGLLGCVSTPKLTEAQCQSSHWQSVGEIDGSLGRSPNFFGHYVQQCAQATTEPNREQWELGRQQGLRLYCTEMNAYKLGREGYGWQAVCPLEGIDKLEEAYSQGRYYYLRQRDMSLIMPHPWHYGRRGWHDPFWRPVW